MRPVPSEGLTKDSQHFLGEASASQSSEVASPACELPAGGYKGWNDGLVTVLKPVITRNCSKLFDGDEKETERIKQRNEEWKNEMSDNDLFKQTQNCPWLKDHFANNLYNTVLEQSFPLAFTFLIHNKPQQVFRLLKLLYRPQNVYCIHYDLKSTQEFKNIFNNLAKCFDNIFIASKIIQVEWGASTIMTAQMNCLTDLLSYRKVHQSTNHKWKYIINLCGTELPLLTSREIVSRLIALNGSSSIKPKIQGRNSASWKRLKPALNNRNITSNTMPYNLTLFKSSSYNAFSYEFAHYLAFDPIAVSIQKFFEEGHHSEEHFYATLYMQPDIPGGFDPNITNDKYFRVEMATWCYSKSCRNSCHGRLVRSVCVSAAGDLPHIVSMSEEQGNLFHNKYSMDLDHTVMDCLEERIVARNELEYKEECSQ